MPANPPAVGPNVVFQLGLKESNTWHSTTYKAGLRVGRGAHLVCLRRCPLRFKAGGFFFGPPGFNTYDPEKLIAYSFGIKNRFFQNRLQANIEGFLYDYQDQQLSVNLR